MLKCLHLFTAIACSSAASFASFDLLLLPGADGRIYRHDPVNNIALGSYAAGTGNLVASDAQGRSFSGGSGSTSIVVNDYSSGEVLGGMTISASRSTEVSGDHMFSHSASIVRRYDVNTGANTHATVLSSAAVWHSLTTFGSVVQILGVHATTGNLALTSALQADTTAGAFFTTTFGMLSGSVPGKAAVAFNPTTGIQQIGFTILDSGATPLLARLSLNSTGAFSSTTPSTTVLNGFNVANFMPATLRSHNGWIVVGQDGTNASLMRIQQFALAGNNVVRLQNYTITAPGGGFATHPSGAYQPSNVVAPEPGSIMALGLGAAVLAKRRRNRR